MLNWLQRTELILGKNNLDKLSRSKVCIVGLGGVGSAAAEFICRAGIGTINIIDFDKIDITNLNRQIITNHSNINQNKTDVEYKRLKEINPNINIEINNTFINQNNISNIIDIKNTDYLIDAIDTIQPKIAIIKYCIENNIKIVSSMGSGNKMDPEKIKITDISKTYECPLAKVIRKELRKINIKKGLKVVFSTEKIMGNHIQTTNIYNKKTINGTISYIPAIFGAFCASVVIRDIINDY